MKICMKDYNLKSFSQKDLYDWEEIVGIIEDLEFENEHLQETIEDMEQDMQSNWRPITQAEQVD